MIHIDAPRRIMSGHHYTIGRGVTEAAAPPDGAACVIRGMVPAHVQVNGYQDLARNVVAKARFFDWHGPIHAFFRCIQIKEVNDMATDPNVNELLQKITDGMRVVDANGDDVGKVTYVQFSQSNAATNASYPDPADDTLLEDFAEAFAGQDDRRNEVEERMLRIGYIRIDAKGIFNDDKVVSSREISDVSGDEVRLSVSKDAM